MKADIDQDLQTEDAEVIHSCGVAYRPCPFMDCRHSLLRPEKVQSAGKKSVGGCPELDRSDTCSLDVAERGGEGYLEIGRRMGMSREMVRITADKAFAKLKAKLEELQTGEEDGRDSD